MPVWGSHRIPPLHPPSKHELGPGLTLKSQLRRAYLNVSESHPDFLHIIFNTYPDTTGFPIIRHGETHLRERSRCPSKMQTLARSLKTVSRNLPCRKIWDVGRHIQVSEHLWIILWAMMRMVIKMVRTAGLNIYELRKAIIRMWEWNIHQIVKGQALKTWR